MALVGMVLISAITLQVNAQGHGRGHGKDKPRRAPHHHTERHDNHKRHHRVTPQQHVHHYHVRPVRHVYHHHHNHSCGHRVVVRHYERPRYIYYNDYDVYYDAHRNVYISFSGRNWVVTTGVPVIMRHVDVHRTGYTEVVYYEDDFINYLGLGRPIYGQTYVRR